MLRERIRQKTQRTRGDSLAKIIEDLNPMVRGWFNYFKPCSFGGIARNRRVYPSQATRDFAQTGEATRDGKVFP